MSIHQNRKDEHIKLAEKFYASDQPNDFNYLKFLHHSFPGISKKDVSLETSFAGTDFDYPFYINGMTGGSEMTAGINESLAIVARETGIAMASGSVSAGIKHPETQNSYNIIRKTNPNGRIFANLGPEHSVENGMRAVEILEADALQIHVNAPQELIMPEGEREFTNWLSNIYQMVEHVGVPVIVKEVGFGMTENTIEQLLAIGVKTVDISGRGGTNFVAIENSRREKNEFSFAEDWGQSTVVSLLESASSQEKIEVLASGGIKSPMEILKALALGAKATGLSGHFLHLVLTKGVTETIAEIEAWKDILRTMMTLLGAQTVEELQQTDIVMFQPVTTWCEARGINWQSYANRKT